MDRPTRYHYLHNTATQDPCHLHEDSLPRTITRIARLHENVSLWQLAPMTPLLRAVTLSVTPSPPHAPLKPICQQQQQPLARMLATTRHVQVLIALPARRAPTQTPQSPISETEMITATSTPQTSTTMMTLSLLSKPNKIDTDHEELERLVPVPVRQQ